MAVLFITVTLLLTGIWNSCEAVFQSFGVVGGVAFMNWTISDLDVDTNRFVRNPFDNGSLLVFFSGEINPNIFDKRVSYSGDISRGIISFTLSGLTPLEAGIYKYMISTGMGNIYAGSQELVIVAVGVRGGDTWMSWRITDTSTSDFRLVKSPNDTTVLAYLTGSYTALVPPFYSNRLTDIGNLSHGIVSYRLTNVTAADVG
ncbi:hypothetical protein CHS0354_018606 [Potamilus streckersoni]|uniref:Uncharacterized protein n=1 Tax=Potamilus streckersoni TaxID=2493646 RepID=A0AAE0TG43_9BIVA|nr:hypothetical protein CHS0354_018606 [Potamilus streckersoni]